MVFQRGLAWKWGGEGMLVAPNGALIPTRIPVKQLLIPCAFWHSAPQPQLHFNDSAPGVLCIPVAPFQLVLQCLYSLDSVSAVWLSSWCIPSALLLHPQLQSSSPVPWSQLHASYILSRILGCIPPSPQLRCWRVNLLKICLFRVFRNHYLLVVLSCNSPQCIIHYYSLWPPEGAAYLLTLNISETAASSGGLLAMSGFGAKAKA